MASEVGAFRTRDTDHGGDPSIPVIVDTWSKGLRNFDINLAYEAT